MAKWNYNWSWSKNVDEIVFLQKMQFWKRTTVSKRNYYCFIIETMSNSLFHLDDYIPFCTDICKNVNIKMSMHFYEVFCIFPLSKIFYSILLYTVKHKTEKESRYRAELWCKNRRWNDLADGRKGEQLFFPFQVTPDLQVSCSAAGSVWCGRLHSHMPATV